MSTAESNASTDKLSTTRPKKPLTSPPPMRKPLPARRPPSAAIYECACGRIYTPRFNNAAFPPVAVVFTVRVRSLAKRAR